MATRTISDAGGNWSAVGSWVGGVVPGTGDTVVATATSGDLAVDTNTSSINVLDLTGYSGTLTINENYRLKVSQAGVNPGSVVFPAGLSVAGTGEFYLAVTSSYGLSIQSNGVVLPWDVVVGTDYNITLLDDLYISGSLSSDGPTSMNDNKIYLSGNLPLTQYLGGTAELHIVGDCTWTSGIFGKLGFTTYINTAGTLTISGTVYFSPGSGSYTRRLTYVSGTVVTTGSTISFGRRSEIDLDGIALNNMVIFYYQPTITLVSDVVCHGNLSASGILSSTSCIVNGPGKAYVGGSLSAGSYMWSGDAEIILNGTGTISGTSTTRNFCNNLTIDTSGTLTLGNVFYYKTGTIKSTSGTITTGNYYLDFRGACSFDMDGNSLGSAHFTTSGIYTLLSDIGCSGTWEQNAVTFAWSGDYAVVFNGIYCSLPDDMEFYDIVFSPGASLHLGAGSTLSVTNSITVVGTEVSGISITSSTPGSTATISKSSGVIAADYVSLTDTAASGGASWYAGSHSTVSNCPGWTVGVPQTSVVFWPPQEQFGDYLDVSFIVSSDTNIEIHYTLDGLDPTFSSTLYTAPFKITGTIIKARAYDSIGMVLGDIYSITYYGNEAHLPSGCTYGEYYLYSNKVYEMAPSGVSYYILASGVMSNAPVVVTSSGYEVGLGDPWAKCSGNGKYTKVGYGYFAQNDNGSFDEAYDEFCLHPDASGKVLFNKIIDENVFIEYEGAGDNYYTMTGIDYNPVRNETLGGFVHFSKAGDPVDLKLTASQGAILADGYRGCTLTATLYDSNYDRVSSKNVVFEVETVLPGLTVSSGVYSGYWAELGYMSPNRGTITDTDASGYAIQVVENTNVRGETHVRYITHDKKTGISRFKAYYESASGVYDKVAVAQYWVSAGPFILDISLLDTLDYLTGDVYTYPG